jgi:hypothetical protein
LGYRLRNSLILIAFVIFAASAFAQSRSADLVEADPAFSLAERLREQGRFFDAITEYKRSFFFAASKSSKDRALRSIGMCYAELEEWGNAIDTLVGTLDSCVDEKEREARELLIAQVEIASKDYERAELGLEKLATFSEHDDVRKSAEYLMGISCVYRFDWERARHYLSISLSDSDPDESEKHRAVLAAIERGSPGYPRSPVIAAAYSTVAPGLGQVYSGNPRDGAVSFLINGSIIAWIGLLAAGGDWVDAIVVANFVFLRFYTGNIANARREAIEYNDALDRMIAERVLSILEEDKN